MINNYKISDIFTEAWKFVKEHLGFLLSYLIIFFVINSFLQLAQNRLDHGFFMNLIIYIASGIIAFFMQMGFIKSALLITAGLKPGYDQLYANKNHFISFVIAHCLYILMVSIGLIFFIFPGCYLMSRFCLYPFFILDKNMGAIEALQAAAANTKGKCWFLFLLILITLLLNIFGCLFFGIGLLLTLPLSVLAWALVYRKITNSEPEIILPPKNTSLERAL